MSNMSNNVPPSRAATAAPTRAAALRRAGLSSLRTGATVTGSYLGNEVSGTLRAVRPGTHWNAERAAYSEQVWFAHVATADGGLKLALLDTVKVLA